MMSSFFREFLSESMSRDLLEVLLFYVFDICEHFIEWCDFRSPKEEMGLEGEV